MRLAGVNALASRQALNRNASVDLALVHFSVSLDRRAATNSSLASKERSPKGCDDKPAERPIRLDRPPQA